MAVNASHGLPESLNILRVAGVRHVFMHQDNAGSSCACKKLLDPEPWATFLAKVPQGALSIWTYAELAEDWTGAPHEGRKSLWVRLIRELQFPRGSLGFFPYRLSIQPLECAAVDHFSAAIAAIAPRTIVYFGVPASHPATELRESVSSTLGFMPRAYLAPSPLTLLQMDEPQLKFFCSSLHSFICEP
jgi:hypothetical protein